MDGVDSGGQWWTVADGRWWMVVDSVDHSGQLMMVDHGGWWQTVASLSGQVCGSGVGVLGGGWEGHLYPTQVPLLRASNLVAAWVPGPTGATGLSPLLS